jgi:hypothetical protein
MTITITGLPSQATVYDNTLIPVETSSVTGHIAASAIKTYIGGYLASGTVSTIDSGTGVFTGLVTAGSLSTGTIAATALTTTADVRVGGNLTVTGFDSITGVSTFTGDISAGNIIASGNITAGNVLAIVKTSSQPFISTLSSVTFGNVLSASGTSSNVGSTITPFNSVFANGYFYANGQSILNSLNLASFSGNIIPSANLTYNIGSASAWWNNIYGTAIHALYADLAERYTSDQDYEPGTVVVFGDSTEVTISTEANDARVAGVVSTNPAYLMNEGIDGVSIALQGRVPCKVTGTVNRGDRMVTSSISGVAMTNNNPSIGTVIGKALGTYSGDGIGIIEVVVGRV